MSTSFVSHFAASQKEENQERNKDFRKFTWGNKHHFSAGHRERSCGRYPPIIKVLSNEIMISFVWSFKSFTVIMLRLCNFRMHTMVEIVYSLSLRFLEQYLSQAMTTCVLLLMLSCPGSYTSYIIQHIVSFKVY